MATKHLVAIEQRLGVRLLHRTTRKITPTDVGRSYLETAERVLAELQEAEAAASADNVAVRGMLRVSMPITYGIREIAARVPAFAKRHPAWTIDLGLNDRVVDLVEERWDMGIRIGRLADSSLQARKLAPCRMRVCASPAYLDQHGRPRTIAELRAHLCLGYTLSRVVGPTSWAFGENGDVSVPVSGPLRASNGDALVEAARLGLGIIYQPEFVVLESIARGDLVSLDLDRATIDLGGVYAIYPPHDRLPAKIRVFIDNLVEQLSTA